jgi:hypothetical protein
MGGYGSGRWRIGCDTVEDCRELDMNRLAREKCLNRAPFLWCWYNQQGEQKASIAIYPEPGGLRLKYNSTIYGQQKNMDYLVPIVHIRVCYGNRPYFLCPICYSQRLKLYLDSKSHYFSCRSCAGLTYTSTRENSADRAMSKSRKIRRRIGASLATMDSISLWDKPKRMRWKTFFKLKSQAEYHEAFGWNFIAQELGMVVKKL